MLYDSDPVKNLNLIQSIMKLSLVNKPYFSLNSHVSYFINVLTHFYDITDKSCTHRK